MILIMVGLDTLISGCESMLDTVDGPDTLTLTTAIKFNNESLFFVTPAHLNINQSINQSRFFYSGLSSKNYC